MTSETFTIPAENLALLQEKIAKLNKRAEKIGCTPIELVVEDQYERHVGEDTVQVVRDVTINGEAPKLNGWQFIATLEHDEDGTIIRRIPTFEQDVDLSPYRNATPENCDHCGYKRRRNDTYIVAYTGEPVTPDAAALAHATKQVGSNCLKDFTGHESPQQVAKFLEKVRDFFEEIRGGGYSEGGFIKRYDTHEFLAFVAWLIRKEGWVSRGKARDTGKTATAQRAASGFLSRHTFEQRPSDDDYALAAATIKWAEGLSEEELKADYFWNLHTVLKNGTLTDRQFNIAASGIKTYEWKNNK